MAKVPAKANQNKGFIEQKTQLDTRARAYAAILLERRIYPAGWQVHRWLPDESGVPSDAGVNLRPRENPAIFCVLFAAEGSNSQA